MSVPPRRVATAVDELDPATVDPDAGSTSQRESEAQASTEDTQEATMHTGAPAGRRRPRGHFHRKNRPTRRKPASITGEIIDPWAR